MDALKSRDMAFRACDCGVKYLIDHMRCRRHCWQHWPRLIVSDILQCVTTTGESQVDASYIPRGLAACARTWPFPSVPSCQTPALLRLATPHSGVREGIV